MKTRENASTRNTEMRIKILTTPKHNLLIASGPATIPTVFDHSKCLLQHINKFMHFGTHL
jgi:hypothetical protein